MTHSERNPAAQSLLDEAVRLAEQREWEQAVRLCGKALEMGAEVSTVLVQMAAIAYQVDDIGNAIQLLEQCLELPGASSDIPEVLAVLHAEAGRLAEALYYGKLATARELDNRVIPLFGLMLPSFAEVFTYMQETPLLTRAQAALENGSVARAVSLFRQHVELEPGDETALAGLARCFLAEGRARAATNLLRSLRHGDPTNPTYASWLGSALVAIGCFAEGQACHRQAVALSGNAPEIIAAALRDLDYDPRLNAEEAADLRSILAPAEVAPASAVEDPSGRALTVGYLCVGLPQADVADFAAVLRHHDRSRVHVIAYGDKAQSHPTNLPYRNAVDRWQDISTMDPETIAAIMAGDGLDILVHVGGLWAPNTLPVLALRPAPVVVAWCGDRAALPAGCGVDHRLGGPDGDAAGLPPLWRLPAPARPIDVSGLSPVARQEEANGGAVLGANVSLAHLNPDVVMCWAMTLLAEPDARLVLFNRDFSDSDNAARLRELFGDFGVSHRVTVSSAATPREFLAGVDVMLVPFPGPDQRSALAALAMGIPAVVLAAAEWPCGQIAETVTQLGLGDTLMAGSLADYIAKAATLARSPDQRQALRLSLPGRVAGSAAMDAKALAAALDQAYAEITRPDSRR